MKFSFVLSCVISVTFCLVNGANIGITDETTSSAISNITGASLSPGETSLNPGNVTTVSMTTDKSPTAAQTTAQTTEQTTKQTTTSSVSIGTTVKTTTKEPGRKFDGASFGGGFALAAGLVIIFAIIYCCYTRRRDGYSQY